jgi:hypothetical protein
MQTRLPWSAPPGNGSRVGSFLFHLCNTLIDKISGLPLYLAFGDCREVTKCSNAGQGHVNVVPPALSVVLRFCIGCLTKAR